MYRKTQRIHNYGRKQQHDLLNYNQIKNLKDFVIKQKFKKWPGEGDSNSRRCYPHWFSRPAHSTTLTSPVKKTDSCYQRQILSKKDKSKIKIIKKSIIR